MVMRRQFGQGFPKLGPAIIEAGGGGEGADILGQGGSPPPIKRSRLGKALKMAALNAVGGALGLGADGASHAKAFDPSAIDAGAEGGDFGFGDTDLAPGASWPGDTGYSPSALQAAPLTGLAGAKAAGLKALSESGGILGPMLGDLLGGEKSKLLDFFRGRK